MVKKEDQVDMNPDQQKVLAMALEFYIRLGLGQFSEIATRMSLLQGLRLTQEQLDRVYQLCDELQDIVWKDSPWKLEDDETSIYTLNAFLLEMQMTKNTKGIKWATDRIKELAEKNKEKII